LSPNHKVETLVFPPEIVRPEIEPAEVIENEEIELAVRSPALTDPKKVLPAEREVPALIELKVNKLNSLVFPAESVNPERAPAEVIDPDEIEVAVIANADSIVETSVPADKTLQAEIDETTIVPALMVIAETVVPETVNEEIEFAVRLPALVEAKNT